MSDEFHKTAMGRKFYDRDVPRIVSALDKISTFSESAVRENERARCMVPEKFRVSEDLSECVAAMAKALMEG